MLNPLELELQAVVSCLMWVLEIKLKPSGRAGSTLWLLAHLYSPTKNTVKLFLGDGPSTDYQEICHMKKKTVEFNLNIPESPTEHLQQRRLDQMSTNIQALMKEHAESYPYRSVHPKSCIPCACHFSSESTQQIPSSLLLTCGGNLCSYTSWGLMPTT